MPKVTNKNFLEFKSTGMIRTISEEEISRALENVKGNFTRQGRALIVCLYYTGARPNEVLRLTRDDVRTEGSSLLIVIKGSKGGKSRTIELPRTRPLIRELDEYVKMIRPGLDLFGKYAGNSIVRVVNKAGVPVYYKRNGDKLKYYFKKWFGGVVEGGVYPYLLRHNAFSKMAESGLTMKDIQMVKGSANEKSILPYIHMSRSISKNVKRAYSKW